MTEPPPRRPAQPATCAVPAVGPRACPPVLPDPQFNIPLDRTRWSGNNYVAMTQKTIGSAIKRWREGRGLTQRGLAARTGLHYVHIGRLERGEGNPTVSTLETLAKVLRTPVVAFFTPFSKGTRSSCRRARRR